MKRNKLFEKWVAFKCKKTMPKKVQCCRCGKIIFTRKENLAVIVDFSTNEKEYYCEKCDKEHWSLEEAKMKERDKLFQEQCPLHKTCCLYCDECEKRGECYYE